MQFNSIEYLLFLPLVFIFYWFFFKKRRVQNLFIVLVSYLFYGWWDWRFLILIAFTTLVSFATGLWIERSIRSGERQRAKKITILNIGINLAILGAFKYFNFFSENVEYLFSLFGLKCDWFTLEVLLPVGISFYTFQALSYTIDVYRQKIRATRDVVAFVAFISFFPQLVAGPIERATNLLPQFLAKRKFDYTLSAEGMRQILWGLFKKVVVADFCAIYVNAIFADAANLSASTLWLGAFLFTFQIYGDFSGYSDMAIGTAKLFGIRLMRNFSTPYFSRSIAEFWRRWHISLLTWFRDYLYIPLGGSRCSKMKQIRNTFTVFLVSGLWHGASWTFVVWGLYHALLFVPLMLLGKNRKYTSTIAEHSAFPSLGEIAGMTTTFISVMIGWVFFRADNISEALNYIFRMFTAFDAPSQNEGKNVVPFIAIMLIVEWWNRKNDFEFQIDKTVRLSLLRWVIYISIIVAVIQYSGSDNMFIYFQF